MLVSSFEVAMQTIASVVSGYLEYEKGVPVITKDGMNRLVNEQFPNYKKEEISPGVYRIKFGQKEISTGIDEGRDGLPHTFSTKTILAWDKFLLEVSETLAEKFIL